jgi:hypothetical protein
LIISDEPNFIFVAVPKTGSCSVEKNLQPLANAQLMRQFNKHATSMRLERELPPQRWMRAYKFAFVREPYAWMHSWYRFRQRDALSNPAHTFNERYTGNISFNEFVQTFSSNELMLKQSDFIARHNGELLVDFVGRYETLQEDFNKVCDRLGLPERKLPKVNVSKPSTTSDETLDAKSIDIINQYFSQDFEMFGYNKR